jgi:hypothetical protein
LSKRKLFAASSALSLGLGILALSLATTVVRAQTSEHSAWKSQETKRTVISQRDRVLLNQALVNDKQHDPANVLIACGPERTEEVARRVTALGGTVVFRSDEIAYLRVLVPLDEFETLLLLPGVRDATIDGGFGYHDVLDTEAQTFDWNWDPRWRVPDAYSDLPVLSAAELKAENPYLPTRDIGAPQFVGAHPTFDGRGTVVADLEVFPYWSHPVFRNARSLDGTIISKFAGILNGGGSDRDLVDMKVAVTADTDGFFQAPSGDAYRAPGPGQYRFGIFRSSAGQSYGVLWSDSQGLVWIDLKQNGNFVDQEPLPDANKQLKIAYVPDAQYIRTSVPGSPFIVAMDAGHDAIHIYEKATQHTTSALSLIAGNGFLGGQANGVAPGSQLLPVNSQGGQLHCVIESFFVAMKSPVVDAVTLSAYLDDFPNDGESFIGLMFNRMVVIYRKQIFAGDGNFGPVLGSSQDGSNSSNVLDIGGYVSAETMSAFTGRDVGEEALGLVASAGPSTNGGLKPDFVTPILSLVAFPCSGADDDPRKTEAVKRFPYQFPPCYGAGEGTSWAGPMAAGAAALLISAAKQSHVSYSPERLRWAMRSSTKYLSNYPAYRQGTGLLQIEAAWNLLKSKFDPPEITAIAPVHHTISRFLKTPDRGPGLYEREGWMAGRSGERTIRLTRQTGPRASQRYAISWLGNDGTFETRSAVELPLNENISVAIKILPRTSGVHSAIFNLVDPVSGYTVYQTMATIVAADQLTRENEFTSENHGTVGLQSHRSYFVEVPEHTSALRVKLQVLRGSVRMHYQDPGPLQQGERTENYPYLAPVMGRKVPQAGDWSYVFARPLAGVWEFGLENWDVDSADKAEFRLKVTALLVGIELEESSAAVGSDSPLPVKFANLYGGLLGSAVHGEQGTMFRSSSSVPASGVPRVFDIHVPAGSKNLMAEIEVASQDKDNLDLYLYDCSTGHCILWDIAMFGGVKQTILARKPKPGLWKALICAERNAGKEISFSYRDVITNPGLGQVTADTETVERRTGEQWTDKLRFRRAPVNADRELVTWIEVVDERAEELERAHSIYDENNPKGGQWNKPSSAGIGVFPMKQFKASRLE